MGTLTPSVSPALPAAQGHSGWNKVALLTAVRNSPCSCPFSVSLTRPQDALNSEPPIAASPTGRARLESPFRAGLMLELVRHTKRLHRLRGSCRRKPTEGE